MRNMPLSVSDRINSYKKSATVRKYCKKILKNFFQQGFYCKDCRYDRQKKYDSEYSVHHNSSSKYYDKLSENFFNNGSADNFSINGQALENYSSSASLKPFIDKNNDSPLITVKGWMMHHTNEDMTLKCFYWRLDSEALAMFTSENSCKHHIKILLSDILSIISDELNRTFEIRTSNCVYFCKDITNGNWDTIIREKLMSLKNNKIIIEDSNTSNNISYHYQIFPGDILGYGQFGIVYGGIHRKTSRPVAIKVINKLRFPPKREARLKNEVSILQNIHFPSIIKIERMFENNERLYIVMEKLCKDMLELILSTEKKRLTERFCKFLIYQILIAVEYLHSHNIVHCDLKPENILLLTFSDLSQVKLCDFGFAHIIGEKSFRQSVVGTPAYLAPEAKQKNKKYNYSLDMWSLGVIIYVSLSGAFPYHEENNVNYNINDVALTYPKHLWKEISPQATDLINNLIELNKLKRYSANKALQHSWFEDYQLWHDLRDLEHIVGSRWLTNQNDDEKWRSYQKEHIPNVDESGIKPL